MDHVPSDVAGLYAEARNCMAVSAHTAAVMACRKLLMNVAVEHGAKEGEKFVAYVDHLVNAGYVPPNSRGWVDHIRKRGNEATHEIRLMTRADAEDIITFVEMLLKILYRELTALGLISPETNDKLFHQGGGPT